MIEPARVNGTDKRATAWFIEDVRGDLIDIEYECADCTYGHDSDIGAQLWPSFDFGDGGAFCRKCQCQIEEPRRWSAVKY